MRALILSLAVVLSLSPLGAAGKPSASTTSKATPSQTAKAAAKSKTTSSSKSKKAAVVRAPQLHPSNERYAEIQQALVQRGYLDEATGVWGNDSVSALKKFQQDQELPVDGKLGALSLTALGLGPRRGAFVVAPEVPVIPVAPVAAD